MNNSRLDRFMIPITNYTSLAVSGESVVIPSGAVGVVVDFYLAKKPIMDSNGCFIGGDGNSSLALTTTAFTNEVAIETPDNELANGDYWVDYLTGHCRGKKASTATSGTANYLILQNSSTGGGGGGSPTGPAGGDLSGTYPNPTVVGLQNRAISNSAPGANQVLEWDATLNQWKPKSEAGLGYGPNLYIVGPVGSFAPYNSIQTAINQAAIDGGGQRTAATPAIILVLPAIYTENVTLKKHCHVVAANGGINIFSTQLAGTVTCNLTLEGSGKLSTFVYWDGVTIQNPPSGPAITFSGTNSQKLFLRNMNYGGIQPFLLMSNTGTVGSNGPSQVQCEMVNITTLANTAYGIRMNAGQLYFHNGQIQNGTTLAGVSPVAIDVVSAAGNFPIYYEISQTQIVGRINVDSSSSTATTPGSILGVIAQCAVQASVTGAPSTALVSVRNNTTPNVTVMTFYQNTLVPSAWSSASVAPIRGTGTVPVIVFSRMNYWNLPGGVLPTILCDGALAISSPLGIIDPSGVTPGNYPATGQIPTFIVDALGRLTAAGSSTNGSAITNVPLGGDATGPSNANTVTKIQNVPVSNTLPTLGQILKYNGTQWVPSASTPQQIVLSMLNPLGVWFSGEYAGPTASNSSGPLTGFGVGVGFARIPKSGVLTNFKLTQATPSGTTVTSLQIYVAPNGLPSLFAYTGVDLGVGAGEYISTDNVSTINVNEDDIVAVYNNEFFGWTPDAMTITADLLIN